MSQVMDPTGAAPETRNVKFLTLLFGVVAAPLFWLGQMMLGYGVTAHACYPGDHPVLPSFRPVLSGVMIGFDAVALLACAAGAFVSWWNWRLVSVGHRGHRHTLHTGEGRDRFLALWGILSSLWFFLAILFNTIASLTVPPCLN